MTATAQPKSSRRSSRPRNRLLRLWESVVFPGDLLALVGAFALLLAVALALEAAGWEIGLRVVLPAAALSLVIGLMLARSQYNDLFALIVSAIYGGALIVLLAALNQSGGLGQGIYDVFARAFQWVYDAFTGGVNQDELVFTLIISGLFWFLGHNMAWHLFRVNQVWRAILPPGLILVINAVYYSGAGDLTIYLIAFVFFGLLLVARAHLDAREWDWYTNGVRAPKGFRRKMMVVGLVLALALLVGWLAPVQNLEGRLNDFQQFMSGEGLTQLGELWSRLFTTAQSEGPVTSDYYGGDSLELGGAIRLGDEIALVAKAANDRRYYWRSRTFDFYDMGRWTSGAEIRLTDPEAPLNITMAADESLAREPVEQTITLGLPTSRLIYTAPQPYEVGLATRTDLRYGPSESMNVSVIRPSRVLYAGDSYDATSMMSVATADQLRTAGIDYPQHIRDLYMSPAPSMTPRTASLAREIVTAAGAVTPYDQAKALETWLRTNIAYDELIPMPPAGQDPVDWLLFDLKRGYCNYYASAMIVMLRSLGAPARMAAGFAQGEWSAQENAFIVRERDAHTWVEVHFPGYGWINFEPTAAQEELNRGDNPNQLPPQTTPTAPAPTATLTPTATFTPTPSPTPQAQPELTEAAEGAPLPQPPSATPIPSPTPTPAPLAIATPPPQTPQPRDPLAFIAPGLTLGFFILFLIALALLASVLVYWYWEWRGMRGLSPVARAYARLERYIGLIGIHPPPQQTPHERREQILVQLPQSEPPVNAITALYTAERYGQRESEAQEVAGEVAEQAWPDVRGSIVRRWLRRVFMPWSRRGDDRQGTS
ncbi:MAG TPA: transglutaminaseTgpA domain-containing protein [Candidatus Limnocylindrales bacterium]|nr:transglutaminaseTgpA domain-containing protein [Candidatus Limnocylindrales bacterium]